MALEHGSDSALAAAVRAAGSQSAFGRLIGKRQSVVNGWLNKDLPLPAEHVRDVERATGVSRYALRPDVYGPQPEEAAVHVGPGAMEHAR